MYTYQYIVYSCMFICIYIYKYICIHIYIHICTYSLCLLLIQYESHLTCEMCLILQSHNITSRPPLIYPDPTQTSHINPHLIHVNMLTLPRKTHTRERVDREREERERSRATERVVNAMHMCWCVLAGKR